jgi:hypothetical protein
MGAAAAEDQKDERMLQRKIDRARNAHGRERFSIDPVIRLT